MAKREAPSGSLARDQLRLIEHDGLVLTISEWARRTGVPVHTLWQRLERGWPVGRALNLPARRYAYTGRYRGQGVKPRDSSVGELIAPIPGPGDESREPDLYESGFEVRTWPEGWVRSLCLELGRLVPEVTTVGDLGLIAKQVLPGCWVLADLDERLRDRMVVDLRRGRGEQWGLYRRTSSGAFEQSRLGTFAEAVAWLKYLDLDDELLVKE